MFIETRTFAPLRDDSQLGLGSTTHEEKYVDMPRFPVRGKTNETSTNLPKDSFIIRTFGHLYYTDSAPSRKPTGAHTTRIYKIY